MAKIKSLEYTAINYYIRNIISTNRPGWLKCSIFGRFGPFWPLEVSIRTKLYYQIVQFNRTYSSIYILVPMETSSGQNGPQTTKNGTFQPPRAISRYVIWAIQYGHSFGSIQRPPRSMKKTIGIVFGLKCKTFWR